MTAPTLIQTYRPIVAMLAVGVALLFVPWLHAQVGRPTLANYLPLETPNVKQRVRANYSGSFLTDYSADASRLRYREDRTAVNGSVSYQ